METMLVSSPELCKMRMYSFQTIVEHVTSSRPFVRDLTNHLWWTVEPAENLSSSLVGLLSIPSFSSSSSSSFASSSSSSWSVFPSFRYRLGSPLQVPFSSFFSTSCAGFCVLVQSSLAGGTHRVRSGCRSCQKRSLESSVNHSLTSSRHQPLCYKKQPLPNPNERGYNLFQLLQLYPSLLSLHHPYKY